MRLTDLIGTLQLSIGPVILISGVGLILLSMTNRFGRVVDRTRLLSQEVQHVTGAHRVRIFSELRIMMTRAKLLRACMALASISVLLASLLIISLFLGALFQWEVVTLVVAFFIVCMLSLILGLSLFILDTNLSLRALWLEIPKEENQDA